MFKFQVIVYLRFIKTRSGNWNINQTVMKYTFWLKTRTAHSIPYFNSGPRSPNKEEKTCKLKLSFISVTRFFVSVGPRSWATFVRLTLNSSSVMRKWYNCWNRKALCRCSKKNHEKQKVSITKLSRLHDVPCSCFLRLVVKIVITLFHACEILPRNLIDNLDCFMHTLKSKCERLLW